VVGITLNNTVAKSVIVVVLTVIVNNVIVVVMTVIVNNVTVVVMKEIVEIFHFNDDGVIMKK
jgi:hypothetical protein